MGIAKHPSRVSLPCVEKPYPSILEFLVQRFPRIEEALWKERISAGKVLDDADQPITLETPFLPQKRLFYYRETSVEVLIPLKEKILFQNDELLVACKPPFLPVIPSGPYISECLLNRLRLRTGNDELVPLHRIDRETSGLVLFSMRKETRGLYGGLFLHGCIEKSYEALSEIARCPEAREWRVENRLADAEPWFRSKVVAGSVNARSRIKLVEYKDGLGHFRLSPLTGKKHQLRVHMSGLGFRIKNDRYYPELLPKQDDNLEKPLQLLARRVKFSDPVSGQIMEFESERRLLF